MPGNIVFYVFQHFGCPIICGDYKSYYIVIMARLRQNRAATKKVNGEEKIAAV
jgi:hypothetical protein